MHRADIVIGIILIILWVGSLGMVQSLEYGNVNIDWQHYRAKAGETCTASRVICAIVWLYLASWLFYIMHRPASGSDLVVDLILFLGVIALIPSYYFYFSDMVYNMHDAAVRRAQWQLNRLKRMHQALDAKNQSTL